MVAGILLTVVVAVPPAAPNEKPLPVPAEGSSLAPKAKPDGGKADSAVGAVPTPARESPEGGGGPSSAPAAFVRVVPPPTTCEATKFGKEPNEKALVAQVAAPETDPDPT